MNGHVSEARTEAAWLAEVGSGARFRFGRNWRAFLESVDEGVILEAERSLREMLGQESIDGRTFLDVGSGSGLFSLAAVRLGARKVHSFDFDAESVACTRVLKERFAASACWSIEQGSALDHEFMARQGEWDVVYSWGVLHHTGAMFTAFEEAAGRVTTGGRLFLAIYNDQGVNSVRWRAVKRLFVSGPVGKLAVCGTFIPAYLARGLAKDLLKLRNPLRRFADYRRNRGMSLFHDWLDWLGGYPFEVARPEAVIDYFRSRGFELRRLKTCGGGHGCNEFVFLKSAGDLPENEGRPGGAENSSQPPA